MRTIKVTSYLSEALYSCVQDFASLTQDSVSAVICDAVREKVRREQKKIKLYRDAIDKVAVEA